MILFRDALEDYLVLRRKLGFKLERAETHLSAFIDFLEQNNHERITQPLALSWVMGHRGICLGGLAQRLHHIRGFARYCKAIDPHTEVPALGLLPAKFKRSKPYIYTEEEIRNLMYAAFHMRFRHKTCHLLPRTYYCLFGLLSVTGLRLSEVLNLRVDDIDLKKAILTIRNTKFGKTRLVPVHASTCEVLDDYLIRRARYWAHRPVQPFIFVTSRGKLFNPSHVRSVFYSLSSQIGIGHCAGGQRPRMHDMRHRFATNTLMNWYKNGQDPERLLPHLSAYLGHIDIASTQWYLEGSPELMKAAMSRLETLWEGLS